MSLRSDIRLFEKDKILRNKDGVPIGRAILRSSYKVGSDIALVLLIVPKSLIISLLDTIFYVDDHPYKIQNDINPIKITTTSIKYMINNFYLKSVQDDEHKPVL